MPICPVSICCEIIYDSCRLSISHFSSQKTCYIRFPLRKNASTSSSAWCNIRTHISWTLSARDATRLQPSSVTLKASSYAPVVPQSSANQQEDVQSSPRVSLLKQSVNQFFILGYLLGCSFRKKPY